MKKQAIVISVLAGILVLALGIGLFLYFRPGMPKNFRTAKAECLKVLKDNKKEMKKIATDLLTFQSPVSAGYYKDYSYWLTPKERCVMFYIGEQGMPRGQDWTLIYTEDGTYYGKNNEYVSGIRGMNASRAVKLEGNWWFLWTDYSSS